MAGGEASGMKFDAENKVLVVDTSIGWYMNICWEHHFSGIISAFDHHVIQSDKEKNLVKCLVAL